MSEAARLISDIQAYSDVELTGEQLRLSQGAALPADVMARAKENKGKVMQALRQDEEAKAIGLVIGIPGTLYTLTLNAYSSLYMEQLDKDYWQAWREGKRNGYSQAKVLASGDFIEVLERVYSYTEFLKEGR